MLRSSRGLGRWFQPTYAGSNPARSIYENLQPAAREQNNINQGLRRDNSTGYKGVSFDSRRNKYAAGISFRGTNYHLGYFISPETAAKAYDKAAKRLFGEFAFLNFP